MLLLQTPTSRVEAVMGMPVTIDTRDDDADPAAVDEAFAWLREVDARFSTYRPDSEIALINAGALSIRDASPDVQQVLDRCAELARETRGAFDARAASADALDPSGLVKGWSVDRAARILERGGHRSFAVNAGGDMVVRGGALPAPVWQIGVQHPLVHDAVVAVVEATALAVATSGAYRRGEHIAVPGSPDPPSGLLSATITGPDLATTDAYATAAFVLGAQAPGWVRELPLRGYEALLVLPDGTMVSTPCFPFASPPAAAGA